MTKQELEAKIANLPRWVQDHIKALERRIEQQPAEMRIAIQTADQLRVSNRKLKERIDALEDLLTCAAKGGHETARAYVDRIIAEYQTEGKDE